MKRKVITFFIILISFLLQSTLFVKLKFGAVSPNLMLVVTSSFGFMRGRKSGMAVGAISGLLVDILGTAPWISYTAIYRDRISERFV